MSNQKQNPANKKLELPKGYRPMSVGQRRLETPEIDGYHLHWFRGESGRILRAQQAGYVFVEKDEVSLNDFDIAGDDDSTGTDLGSRVSVISGDDIGPNGQAGRMYLMKCPQEIYEYAQGLLNDQVDSNVGALRGGTVGEGRDGENAVDSQQRYLKEANSNIFTRKR